MVNLVTLLTAWPKGMWESLIKVFYDGLGNYVVAILLLTLCIKVALLPLDFLQRYKTSSFSRSQAYLKPQIDKLNKRYGNNQKLLNDNLNKLYKENNVKMGSSCLIIALSLILNMVVVITFWNGMNAVSKYQVTNQYEQYKDAYYSVYNSMVVEESSQEEIDAAILAGQQNVEAKYDDINIGFLWIKNIWRPDTTTKAVPTFEDWVKISGVKYETDELKAQAKEEYNTIMKLVIDNHQEVNGYFITPILVLALMVISQWLTRRAQLPPKEKRQQLSEEQLKQMKSGKVMMFVLPVIMLFFVINTAALFAIYMFVSTLLSTCVTPLITKLVNTLEKKQDKKREEAISVDYRRK